MNFSPDTLGIGVTMFLRDQFTGPSRNIRASAKAMQDDLNKSIQDQLKSTRNLNAGYATLGISAVMGLSALAKEASKYSYTMRYVKAATNASEQSFAQLDTRIKSLAGGKSPFMPIDIANTAKQLAIMGYSADDLNASLDGIIATAIASQEPLETVAHTIATTINMFNDQFSKKDAGAVGNMLSIAAVKSAADIHTMGESIRYAGATLAQLKVPLKESLAMLMVLHDVGIPGSMAGTSLDNLYRFMAKAYSDFRTKRQSAAMAAMGISPGDMVQREADGTTRIKNTMELMQMFHDRLGNMSDAVAARAISSAGFNERGSRGLLAIIRHTGDLKKHLNELGTNGQFVSNLANEMMKEPWQKFLQIAATTKTLGIEFLNTIAPTLNLLLTTVNQVIKGISWVMKIPFLGSGLMTWLTGFLLVKTAVWSYRAIVAGLKLIHMQAGTSAAAASTTAAAGWRSATVAAEGYAATAAAASGIGGKVWGFMGNQVKYNPNLFRGKGGFTARSASGGFQNFSTQAAATAWASRAAAASSGLPFLSGIIGSIGRVTGLLGRVLGFMGRPWGMALSFGLPLLISLLTKYFSNETSSSSSNTEDTGSSTEALRKRFNQRAGIIIVRDPLTGRDEILKRQFIPQDKEPKFHNTDRVKYDDYMRKSKNPTMNLNLIIDGEKRMKKVVKDTTSEDIYREYGLM